MELVVPEPPKMRRVPLCHAAQRGYSSSKAGQRRLVWSYRLSWDSIIPLGPHQVGLSHRQYIHHLQGDLAQPLLAASLASVVLTCFLQSSARAGSMRYEASGSQCVSCRQREISDTATEESTLCLADLLLVKHL